ncbi:MAG: hypothetical protein LBV22_02090, partial [Mycoplasmataceae bacterium]|nr:hypothetical protein [Mycoplasmataceae bacterium]
MLLKLRRILLLSGIGLITIGAITPIVSSCSKKAKADATQEPIYNAEIVKSLFEQFIENYEALVSGTEHEASVNSDIAGFEKEYADEELKADADGLSEADKYGALAKWVKDKAALYDIVLVEWTNVNKSREAMMESTLIQNHYSEDAIYAVAAQNDFINQGTEENKSFNQYVDGVEDYTKVGSSATLFPRSHAYTLHTTSREINREFNAVAAKANLLSQTIDNYLILNEDVNIFTYLSTDTETSPFETDGILKYDSSGHALDFSKTTTQIVGEDGNYLDASGSAYRLLTKAAAKDLFNYSYLDLDAEIGTRAVKPFDGTKIFSGDTYEVSIALHVKSSDSSLDDSEQLLSYDNYTTMQSTFEFNVVVTNTKNKFPLVDPSTSNERYEDDDTDETHKINYFSLVGSKTHEASIPTDVAVEHGTDFLTDILGYDKTDVRTIVDAFGVVFADIKKDERGADGRPTEAAKLDEDMVKPFYLLASDGEKKNGLVSFTDKYGTNG